MKRGDEKWGREPTNLEKGGELLDYFGCFVILCLVVAVLMGC